MRKAPAPPPITAAAPLFADDGDRHGSGVRDQPAPIFAGAFSKVAVKLRSVWTGPNPLIISLSNDQNLPGFPSQIVIPVNQDLADFRYAFPSRAVATGNPDQPEETQSASPLSPAYTVRITAQASRQQVGERAPDYENIQAVKVENPIMRIFSRVDAPFQQAKGPVWSPGNGLYVSAFNRGADPNRQPPGFSYALFKVCRCALLPSTSCSAWARTRGSPSTCLAAPGDGRPRLRLESNSVDKSR